MRASTWAAATARRSTSKGSPAGSAAALRHTRPSRSTTPAARSRSRDIFQPSGPLMAESTRSHSSSLVQAMERAAALTAAINASASR